MVNITISHQDLEVVALGVPLVVGIVQVAKHAGLGDQYAPAFAIVAALCVAFVLLDDPASPAGLIVALMIGLSASGLYDHGKSIADTLRAKDVGSDPTL